MVRMREIRCFQMTFRFKIAVAAVVLAAIAAAAQPAQAQKKTQQRTRISREEYIDSYKRIAVAHMERYGIPASITMAQGILESDCGNSTLSVSSNNHFGIKCKKNWTGERVYHDDDEKGECFRKYPSVEASYADHAEFLDSQTRYDSLFAYAPTDYKSWARGLKAAGYATAPDYAERLIRIIEESRLYLLDRDDGLRLYASQLAGKSTGDTWFADQSSVGSIADRDRIDPDDYRISVNTRNGYGIYRTNGLSYVIAKEGDTYASLGEIFRLSAKNLRTFNDRRAGEEPAKGDVVFIRRKLKQWEGNVQAHTVLEGETLYSISQTYGIRLKSLAKLNGLKQNAKVAKGDRIKLK